MNATFWLKVGDIAYLEFFDKTNGETYYHQGRVVKRTKQGRLSITVDGLNKAGGDPFKVYFWPKGQRWNRTPEEWSLVTQTSWGLHRHNSGMREMMVGALCNPYKMTVKDLLSLAESLYKEHRPSDMIVFDSGPYNVSCVVETYPKGKRPDV